MRHGEKMAKRDPNEWQSLQVRLPEGESLAELNDEVDSVAESLTKRGVENPFGENKKSWRRNHVILEAIEIGLKELRKRR